MTVNEMAKLIEDEQYFVLIDSISNAQVLRERSVDGEIGGHSPYDKFKDCEVLGIRVHSDSEVAFYIDAPARRFETWLDVTYSLKLQFDVPYGESADARLEELAKEILNPLPSTITLNGNKWDYGYSNIESGNAFDCLEEV